MKYHIALIAALAAPVLAAGSGRAQDEHNMAQEELKVVAQAGADTADPFDYSLELSDALGTTAGEATRALIIPKEAAEPKDLANIEEDLRIMAHILQKAAGGGVGKSHNAMGISIHRQILGRASLPQNLYLEGYGALFFLSVNYPLVEPAVKKTESEAKDQTSSEWEEARRELAQPSGPQGFGIHVRPTSRRIRQRRAGG